MIHFTDYEVDPPQHLGCGLLFRPGQIIFTNNGYTAFPFIPGASLETNPSSWSLCNNNEIDIIAPQATLPGEICAELRDITVGKISWTLSTCNPTSTEEPTTST
jgi:hypothetical protein